MEAGPPICKCVTQSLGCSAELVKIISYPESPTRIIVLLKALWRIIENLNKQRSERKELRYQVIYHFISRGEGVGGTPLFGLYGDGPLDRVWFFGLAVRKWESEQTTKWEKGTQISGYLSLHIPGGKGGRGELPYLGYTGTAHWTGYGFLASLS